LYQSYIKNCAKISQDIDSLEIVVVDVHKLRELRQRRVLTLRELEARSGVSYNTIWRLENGKGGAQPRTIRKLAAALGVEPEALIKVGGADA
jgi:transcriptional regulator with XRE-family HTH domain